jgi:hypothetical protein
MACVAVDTCIFRFGESRSVAAGDPAHFDASHQIRMILKPKSLAVLVAPLQLVSMTAHQTLAPSSPLSPSEAQYTGLNCFLRNIVLILVILPRIHALILMAPAVLIANQTPSGSHSPSEIPASKKASLRTHTGFPELSRN